MSAETNPHLVLVLESSVLRALCSRASSFGSSDAEDVARRAAALASLRAYRWQDPEHRVIYEALALLPGRPVTELREQLPAQTTRMGFPDVNWDAYFGAAADDSAIGTRVAELLAASGQEKL